ncbi:hypothetical protein HKD37_08G020685 [Glycine soja]|uniref:Chromatin modification-related protein EAF7 n=1 Tax=Glycine soja TaxID=3848 RepID=A0A445J848_GLYSO|nr:hypothetical protein D0Y65_019246 [Glycine soja]
MSSGGRAGKPKEEEQDGMSVHSPCKPPPSSASSLPKEQSQVELELRLLEALEIYPPMKLQVYSLFPLPLPLLSPFSLPPQLMLLSLPPLLQPPLPLERGSQKEDAICVNGCEAKAYCIKLCGGVHRHFVLYGLMEFLRRKFDRQFSSEEVLQLLDRFYNLEMLKTDDDEIDLLTREEEFSLPQSFFVKEET